MSRASFAAGLGAVLLGGMLLMVGQWYLARKHFQFEVAYWPLREMKAEKGFYIDRFPRCWMWLVTHRPFIAKLKGMSEPDYPESDWKAEFVGIYEKQPGCANEALQPLRDALRPDGDLHEFRKSAVCVSPTHAKMFCSTFGGRLPTPEEWNRALSRLRPERSTLKELWKSKDILRLEHAEWAMREEHGSQVFYMMGASGTNGHVPVAGSETRIDVGFRCVMKFPESARP